MPLDALSFMNRLGDLASQYIPDDPTRKALVNWGGPWEEQREWLSHLALAMHQGGQAGG